MSHENKEDKRKLVFFVFMDISRNEQWTMKLAGAHEVRGTSGLSRPERSGEQVVRGTTELRGPKLSGDRISDVS